MVVVCPRCTVKLKVDDAKLTFAGSRFKCPKCSSVLLVKNPAPVGPVKKTPARTTVLAAHSDPKLLEDIRTLLQYQGYKVITSTDGIDAMVKAVGELPSLAVIEVSLPKIYGFEICKRLKSRAETKDLKCILVPSISDKSKYSTGAASLYGADDYIEAHDISAKLIEKINKLLAVSDEGAEKPQAKQKCTVSASETAEIKAKAPSAYSEYRPESEVKQQHPPVAAKPSEGKADETIEKARRLSRTIIDDIYLYNSAKVMESIRNGNFYAVFAAELNEGQKLYESRIPQEIRKSGNYYREVIDNFISRKKKELS